VQLEDPVFVPQATSYNRASCFAQGTTRAANRRFCRLSSAHSHTL